MYIPKQKRFYTPQFSSAAAVSVRRLAWALNKPMTETVDYIVRLMPSILKPGKVCLACEDNTKCHICAFRNPPTKEEKAALVALVKKPQSGLRRVNHSKEQTQ